MKLNCDMGESYGAWRMGADELLMPHIDMANIACGGHASDPVTMDATVALACAHQVQVGAHPGYPDKEGFGRRAFPLAGDELGAHLLFQIGALDALCRKHATRIRHVKPHGALYNQMMRDSTLLETIFKALQAFDPTLPLVVQAADSRRNDTLRAQAADYDLTLLFEAFADRAYSADGHLAPRSMPGAVHHSSAAILEQARRLMTHGEVQALSGETLHIEADTLCLHGDNPLSPEVAKALHANNS